MRLPAKGLGRASAAAENPDNKAAALAVAAPLILVAPIPAVATAPASQSQALARVGAVPPAPEAPDGARPTVRKRSTRRSDTYTIMEMRACPHLRAVVLGGVGRKQRNVSLNRCACLHR